MTQEEQIEQMEKEHDFLLQHGTDLKVKINGLEFTLYFQKGKYQIKIYPEENEVLTGFREKAVLYINKNCLPAVKGKDYDKILEGAEIV